jgi:hypothetical protein
MDISSLNPSLAEGVKRAKSITRVLFEMDISTMNAEEVLEALVGDRRLFTIPADEMYGTTILKLTVNHGVTKNTSASPQGINAFSPIYPSQVLQNRWWQCVVSI